MATKQLLLILNLVMRPIVLLVHLKINMLRIWLLLE